MNDGSAFQFPVPRVVEYQEEWASSAIQVADGKGEAKRPFLSLDDLAFSQLPAQGRCARKRQEELLGLSGGNGL